MKDQSSVQKLNYVVVKTDIRNFSRKLKLREKFWGNDFEDESLVKHPSTYNPKCDNSELSNVIMTLERLDPLPKQYADNLTKSERKAIDELRTLSRSDIVIKKADKGNTLVIIDKFFMETN